jgi:16S rRNA (cytidine1402-2'-O)-methyltransferase
MPSKSPTLWVVATPLGNPGDASDRARRILSRADALLAEDTRRAGLLFKRLGIESDAGFISFFEHNEEARIKQVLELLQDGKEVALLSDAGTPLISDPGYRLVRACREAGHRVSPIPGPSAVTAALSASGLPPQPFLFLGFLPRKESERRKVFADCERLTATIVFFERKNRLASSLKIAAEVLGVRELCIARELTKEHEQFILARLDPEEPPEFPELGEFTVLLGPPEHRRSDEGEVARLLEKNLRQGGKPREVVRRTLEAVNGWTSKEIYALMDEIKQQSGKG